MMKTKWNFSISTGGRNPSGPTSIGMFLGSPQEVEDLVESCGFKLTSSFESRLDSRSIRALHLMEPSDSPRLLKLLVEIERRYGWKPSEWYVVPKEKRSEYFGLRKHVEFSKREIEEAEYLSFFKAKTVARYVEPTLEQAERELFVTKGYKPKKTVAMGCLTPWMKLALRTDLLRFLEMRSMRGLSCTEVIGAEDLWKLHASVTLPRSLTRLIDKDGHEVHDSMLNKWSEQCGWRTFDGGGYVPDQLRYKRGEIEALGEFDIAVSCELEGDRRENADHRIILSRRFREALEEFGVKGVKYAPVILE